MRKILFLLVMLISFTISAQEHISVITYPTTETPNTTRVYAELLGHATNIYNNNKNVTVSIDLGQYQSKYKAYTLLDSRGSAINFSSMVAVMNYMGERGWKFIQAYVLTENNKNVYHWLMYKDVYSTSQIYDGLSVKNTQSEYKTTSRRERVVVYDCYD